MNDHLSQLNLPTIEALKERTPLVPKATSRISETVNPYEKHFNWDNTTYFRDRLRLYIAGNLFVKRHITVEALVKMLDWAKAKDLEGKTLHIRQFIELLNTR